MAIADLGLATGRPARPYPYYSSMLESVTVQAPAKLNLALSVGPTDRDGMHPICSWMVTIDLCDNLVVDRLPQDRLSRYAILWHEDAKRPSDIDWPITRDLAVRAHLALESYVSRQLPLQLKLQKRIPVGGGLGGGSSNAAAMLRAVNELFDLGVSLDDIRQISWGLGSDVPFFVAGGSAIIEGLGEQIESQETVPDLNAVIVFPEASCPTGHVYNMFDEIGPGPLRPNAVRALAGLNGPLRPDAIFNDLAAAAVRVAPTLQEHLARLTDLAERPAHVAGSGSSIFVLLDDPLHAQALAETVEKRLSLPAVAVGALATDPTPIP